MRAYNQQSKIRGALRSVARYMPQKKAALLLAIDPYRKGTRGGNLYICKHCNSSFKGREVQVDHIEPVVPTDREIVDWNEYIERLFCSIDNLQVLCKPCHLVKSNNEESRRGNIRH